MDLTAKALLETVADLGCVVTVEGDDGRFTATARSHVEALQVRADCLYDAACELAEMTAVELEDG